MDAFTLSEDASDVGDIEHAAAVTLVDGLPASPSRPATAIDGLIVTLSNPAGAHSQTQHGFMGHQIVHVSDDLAARLGYTSGELVGRPYTAVLDHDLSLAEWAPLESELETTEPVEMAQTLRGRDGRLLVFQTVHMALPALPGGFQPEQDHSAASPDLATGTSRYRLIQLRDANQYSEVDAHLAEMRHSPAVTGDRRSGWPHRLGTDLDIMPSTLPESGSDLSSLAHTVAAEVVDRIGGQGECWVGVADHYDRCEAVVCSGENPRLVARTLQLLLATGDPTGPRCVLVQHLPRNLHMPLADIGVHALWAFPIADANRQQRGVLVVAHHHDDLPNEDDVRLLDHLAQVLVAGIERAGVEARVAQQALHDPLTRLPSRALIVDRLEQALVRLDREPSSLSVLLVDIDRFKSINEYRGVEVGDLVLAAVAGRLMRSVRAGDTVGRISADQYLMICMSNADLDVSVVARRVTESLAKPIEIEGAQPVHITASVGVVTVDDTETSPSEVIGNAEAALAVAVKSGRGRYVVFDEKHQSRDLVRHELEQALGQAITGGELVVHYQPVCEVQTGRMIGAEALIRWDRPGHGLLAPGAFIEIAEESGLIVPLGTWVIERVAEDLASWPRSGGWAPVVTVNLSARQLSDPALVPLVDKVLAKHNLPPVRLGFEVTESMRIDDFEVAVDSLERLANLGCRIAVDDFGIGHATLDYLRRFSMANVLKIDRSFVAGLGVRREDTAIVDASLALARSLQLNVVAEGVENGFQLTQLARLGCQFAQGYALSKPVPLDQAKALWAQGHLFIPGV